MGHNEIIGVCRLGSGAEGLGRDHWNEMLAYPRKPIAHWHPLLESKKSEKEVSNLPPANVNTHMRGRYNNSLNYCLYRTKNFFHMQIAFPEFISD